jgi:prepilin-type N-terminal cleavage/methylation domain-containing protein
MDNNRRERLKTHSLRGFTLIEVVVVIAIIGILSSLLTFAASAYIRDSNIHTANESAREALTYVQNWLINLEIKDTDLSGYVDPATSTYFQIVSDGGTVSLIQGDPTTATTLTPRTGLSTEVEKSIETLTESISAGFAGNWRVIVNATDYTAELAYWQDEKYTNKDIFKTDDDFFPESTMTQNDQSTQIAANTYQMFGQYPFGA